MPASRQRALAALRLEEREAISRGIAVGRSIRQIAQGLGRAPSRQGEQITRPTRPMYLPCKRPSRRRRARLRARRIPIAPRAWDPFQPPRMYSTISKRISII